MSLQSFEAIYDHGVMKWLGDQPADIEAHVIVTILAGQTAAPIITSRESPHISGVVPVVRRPHSDIACRTKIIGDIFDSAPSSSWDLPKGV